MNSRYCIFLFLIFAYFTNIPTGYTQQKELSNFYNKKFGLMDSLIQVGRMDTVILVLEKHDSLVNQLLQTPNYFTARYHRTIAKAYSINLNADLALLNYLIAYDQFWNLGLHQEFITTVIQIMEYYRKIGNYEMATNIGIKLERWLSNHTNVSSYQWAYYYNRRAAIESEKNNIDLSRYYLGKCIQISDSLQFYNLLGACYNELGFIEFNKSNVELSEIYFNKSIGYYESDNNTFYKASVMMNKAHLFVRHRILDKAQKTLDEAFLIIDGKNWLMLELDYWNFTSLVMLYQNKQLEHRTARLKGLETEIKIIGKTNRQKIHEIEKVYDQKKNLEVIASQKKEIEAKVKINNKTKQLNQLFIYASSLTAVLLILVSLSAFYLNRLNRRLHSEKTALKTSNENLQKLLNKNEGLIKEVHHRVKNNLQLISSLLDMQQRIEKNERTSRAFKDARNRISSMALVHQSLYEKDDLQFIDAEKYFMELSRIVDMSIGAKTGKIITKIQIKEIYLSADMLIPLALIINELMTNSFKYAFKDKSEGIIEIKLSQSENAYQCEYFDNGSGINQYDEVKKGLGTLIIHQLIEQLKGVITREETLGHYRFAFNFKKG